MITHTDKEAELDRDREKKWNPFEKLFGIRREAPEFKRCCFCLPLRRGLIGWGYIKLGLDMLAIGLMAFLTAYLGVAAVIIVEMVFLLTDAAFNVLLIVGGHQKSIKFLKITYIYSLVLLGLTLLCFCWLAYVDIRQAVRMLSFHEHFPYIVAIMLPGFCLLFAIFFVQIYWVLLIRSLVAKLQDQTMEFQFTNPSAAEAQCTLHKHNPSATEAQCTLHKHNPSATEAQCTLHKHNPSATEAQCTLHKHNPSATEAQCTLHKHNPSATEALRTLHNPVSVTDESNEKLDASLVIQI